MANKNFGSQTQFDYLYDGIAQKYPAVNADGVSTVFQFTGSPMEANWGDGAVDINAYNFANAVSASLGGYYTPMPGSLVNAYSSFLGSLDSPASSSNPTYQGYQQQSNNLDAQILAAAQAMKIGYTNYTAGGGTETALAWQQDIMGGKTLFDNYTGLQAQKTNLANEMATLAKELDGPLATDLLNLSNAKYMANYSDAAMNTTNLPKITIAGNLATDKARWDAYPDGQFDLDVVFTGKETIVNPWKKIYDTTASQQCFKTSVHTDVDISRIIQDVAYKVEVKYKGLISYNIVLGGWYDGSMVNPKTAKFPVGSLYTNDSFFGTSGSLHLLPSQVWVAYQPSISITTTTDTFKEQYTLLSNANVDWLDIFGAHFDIAAGASMEPVTNQDNTTTVTFTPPKNSVPQVLGVTSFVRYNGDE